MVIKAYRLELIKGYNYLFHFFFAFALRLKKAVVFAAFDMSCFFGAHIVMNVCSLLL